MSKWDVWNQGTCSWAFFSGASIEMKLFFIYVFDS